MSRRHRPAAGQLMLLFVAALGDVRRAAGSDPRTSAGPAPYGSTELATPPPWKAREAARGDDGPQGGSVRARVEHIAVYAAPGRPPSRAGLVVESC